MRAAVVFGLVAAAIVAVLELMTGQVSRSAGERSAAATVTAVQDERAAEAAADAVPRLEGVAFRDAIPHIARTIAIADPQSAEARLATETGTPVAAQIAGAGAAAVAAPLAATAGAVATQAATGSQATTPVHATAAALAAPVSAALPASGSPQATPPTNARKSAKRGARPTDGAAAAGVAKANSAAKPNRSTRASKAARRTHVVIVRRGAGQPQVVALR